MKSVYKKLIKSCEKDRDLHFLISIQRSIFQTAAYSSIEYFGFNIRDYDTCDISSIIQNMLQPGDYNPLSTLDSLIPVIRNSGWYDCVRGWYKDENIGLVQGNLARRFTEWIEFRNSKVGHGVLDEKSKNENFQKYLSLAYDSLELFGQLIPIKTKTKDQKIKLIFDTFEINLEVIRQVNDRPIIIRNIRNQGSSWVVTCCPVDKEESDVIKYELPLNCCLLELLSFQRSVYQPKKFQLKDKEWRIYLLLPEKQTTSFEGRAEELKELYEWINDEDSRACMVYGDGGIGKTTLILEFLNELFIYPPDNLTFFPEIITFYSAKKTRWTENGLINISSIDHVVDDAVRELLKAYFGHNIDKEFYKISGEVLINRAAQFFNELGYSRDQILIILDNTETLAKDVSHEKKLGKEIKLISKKLARVLISTRRREDVEAKPIELQPLNEFDGAKLLERVANDYEAKSLMGAGVSTLKKISRQLAGKPLLIDLLARYIAYRGLSIEKGLEKIMQEADQGLGEFLYQDAWERLNDEQKNIMMLLSCLKCPLNNITIGWACGELKMPHIEFLNILEETNFGRFLNYGAEYDFELNDYANHFFSVKLKLFKDSESNEEILIYRLIINKSELIKNRYEEYQRAEVSIVSDRIQEAFRTSPARAAKLAVQRGDYDAALDWYIKAIDIDKDNPFLFDRFAYFLMQYRKDLKEAEKYTLKAISLNKDNCEPYYTLAMILYRQGRIRDADKNIEISLKLGKEENLCFYQMGRARFEQSKKIHEPSAYFKLLDEADHYIRKSMSYLSKNYDNSGYKIKAMAEGRRIIELIKKKRKGIGKITL